MSSPSTYLYETVCIVNPALADKDVAVINQKVDSVISKFSGKVSHRDDWGIKELAYPIRNKTSGRYIICHYSGKTGVVNEIERHFKISDDVFRYLTVSVSKQYDYSKLKKQMAILEEEAKKMREAKRDRIR